ncbi:HSPB1-associated protein 1 homolog [Myripristis murdjan]|uniref:Hspb associated protein 1 n=1 Tax=Myripristis murdjan TaxID=586833 RepID=A0A668AM10_9TELE|nr:HSPB1-associated protein 1 [Myripristis murdjan]XP_029936338.1 HSPB1-associated protein 1 [Myripristis murdjan]XP_029936339.1 HSPB1-associated protein 1 [Myripristis murdjan]XP_029936340.1 HSPB1-associated protein 1 [Myripristis murdjan]
MATPTTSNPFSPEEAQRILHGLQQPAVFLNMTGGWPVRRWSAEHLSGCLGDRTTRFRLGRKDEANTPLFETQCSYVEARLGQFLSWAGGQAGTDVGPFSDYPSSEYWAYADYKYIATLFQDQPSMFEDVMWSEFGFSGRNGRQSTLWIGTEGANTPCHLDSYGCNLVLQVQGRKRWHLFPPEDAANLYPTRIPYEESSVFSQVDVLKPDLKRFPAFRRARHHAVTLQPGQVLYVPRHWWHYVESVDPVTVSVNSWIELETDDEARVGEAVTKAVVLALKTTPSDYNADNWLNPTEEGVTSHDENMQYVNLALRACAERQRCRQTSGLREPRPVKRDSGGRARKSGDLSGESVPFIVSFGPHLIPVRCEQKDSPENLAIRSSLKCAIKSQSGGEVRPSAGCEATHDCSPVSDQCRACASVEDDETEDSGYTPITTNDLLDCLVHPDIITRVSELLLERQRGANKTTKAS